MQLFPRQYFVQWLNSDLVSFCHILKGIYILLGLPMKEWKRGGTKLSEGQLFTFRDQQDSCLPSVARLDSPGDQGKGKVGLNKVLFFQKYNFFQG